MNSMEVQVEKNCSEKQEAETVYLQEVLQNKNYFVQLTMKKNCSMELALEKNYYAVQAKMIYSEEAEKSY